MPFASIYPLYIEKVERKGHTEEELDQVLTWLTGYDKAGLQKAIDDEVTLEAFFAEAPGMNPNTSLITGIICGYRVEDIDAVCATLRERGVALLYDEPKIGTGGSRIQFAHPKSTGGILLELVEPAADAAH